MKRDDTVYLQHILAAIARAETYLQDIDEAAFITNFLVQDGIIRQLEIIGEATRRLSVQLRNKYDPIPWDDIAGMRGKLIHDYFGVDIDKVWLTAIEDLPTLKEAVTRILAELSA
ncbi:MAG: DUF86 domain-containing protein [Candidatus Competibacteraceae bacterium]